MPTLARIAQTTSELPVLQTPISSRMGEKLVTPIRTSSTLSNLVKKAALPIAFATQFVVANAQDYTTKKRFDSNAGELAYCLLAASLLIYTVYYATRPAPRR